MCEYATRWFVGGDETLSDESNLSHEAGPETSGHDADPADGRRHAVAREVVRILSRAVDPSVLDIQVADGSSRASGADDVTGGPATTSERRARARVVVNGPDALGRLLFPPTPDAFAEGFLRGDLEIEGDVMAAVDAGEALNLRRLSATDVRQLVRWSMTLRRGASRPASLQRTARMVGARHSRARDLAAIRFHYDVGEAFYRLWLDRRLTYSCAYFPPATTPESAAGMLDEAQEAKLGLIARKLSLKPGIRLLDVGCGWGSLLEYAAASSGVEATVGVTLSERQADEANRRLVASDLGGLARAEVRDYRDLGSLGQFDAVASVGMFEHVGRANLSIYFRAAFEAVRPGGLFLNHGIAQASPQGRLGSGFHPGSSHFVDRYVFPDGELVTVEAAIAAARAAGFELIDVQSLRPHYALTLAAWVARLEASWDEAVAAAGEEVARTWRLYMSAARLGFERGDLDVCQLLLAKPDRGSPARVPLRPWW